MNVSRPSPAMVPGRHQDSAGVPAKTRLRERVEIATAALPGVEG